MAAEETPKRPVSNIAYTLTIYAGGEPQESMALPNNPSEMTWEEDFPTNVEYTFGAMPKREHNKPKRWKVGFSGRTGVESRKQYEEETEVYTPLVILENFGLFLERYQRLAANAGATQLSRTTGILQLAARIRMVLSCSKENTHLFVEPGTFSFNRSAASARQSAMWSVNFTGWAKASDLWPIEDRGYSGPPSTSFRVLPESADAAILRQLKLAEALSAQGASAEDWAQTAAVVADMQRRSAESRLAEYKNTIGKLTPGTGAPSLLMDSALGTYFPASVKYAMTAGAAATDFAQKMHKGALQFRRGVEDFRKQLRAGLDVLHMTQRVLMDLANGASNIRAILQDVIDEGEYVVTGLGIPAALSMMYMADVACADATIMVGTSGGKFKGIAGTSGFSSASGALSNQDQGFGSPFLVPTGAGSWMDVALAVYGDENYWLPLAKLNAASDAYSNSLGKPLQPGDTVFLPSEGGALISGGQPNVDSFYLTDVMLTATGGFGLSGGDYLQGSGADLVLVMGSGGDIQTVTGYANLIQAITTLSRTPQGALADASNYGLLRIAPGDQYSPHAAATAMALARAQLTADHRIAEVRDPSVLELRDGIALKFTVIPAGATPEPLTVVAPLPAQ